MDRNTLIGLLLIFSLVVGYSWWASPSAEERQATQAQRELEMRAQYLSDSIAQALRIEEAQAAPEQAIPVEVDSANAFAYSLQGQERLVTIENDLMKTTFTNKGGRIASVELKDYKTWKQEPLLLLDQQYTEFYFAFFSNNRNVRTDQLYFEMLAPSILKVEGSDSLTLAMRLYPMLQGRVDSSRYMELRYTLHGDQYMMGMELVMVGLQEVIQVPGNALGLNWQANLKRNEKSPKLEDPNTAVYYKPVGDDVDYLSETRDDKESILSAMKWISFKQQFFSTTLIAKDKGFSSAEIENYQDKNLKEDTSYCKTLVARVSVPYEPKDQYRFGMELYTGPNKFYTLKSYDQDLERLLPIGWSFFLMQWINRFAVIPLFTFLENTNLSYGIIILILTILLKLVLAPITYKSYVSSAKTRLLKPEIDELSKKFPKPEQAMDKQRAVMTLYKKAGVNQLAGCIPMLVQLPILLAMFRFFPASIELRQESFLWADDLSSYDSIMDLPFDIPFYGDHISLFALLMAISNLLYTRMSMKQNSSSMTMPGMKMMMYIMPIMFLGILNSYSSALNYYYTVSTCMTFLITWVIQKSLNEEKLHRQIQENKKKPIQKSKFQQRIEKMAQQAQAQQNAKPNHKR